MREIEAISNLAHKNIVGYKGCWVEAAEIEASKLQRITSKIQKRRKDRCSIGIDEKIEERSEDDS